MGLKQFLAATLLSLMLIAPSTSPTAENANPRPKSRHQTIQIPETFPSQSLAEKVQTFSTTNKTNGDSININYSFIYDKNTANFSYNATQGSYKNHENIPNNYTNPNEHATTSIYLVAPKDLVIDKLEQKIKTMQISDRAVKTLTGINPYQTKFYKGMSGLLAALKLAEQESFSLDEAKKIFNSSVPEEGEPNAYEEWIDYAGEKIPGGKVLVYGKNGAKYVLTEVEKGKRKKLLETTNPDLRITKVPLFQTDFPLMKHIITGREFQLGWVYGKKEIPEIYFILEPTFSIGRPENQEFGTSKGVIVSSPQNKTIMTIDDARKYLQGDWKVIALPKKQSAYEEGSTLSFNGENIKCDLKGIFEWISSGRGDNNINLTRKFEGHCNIAEGVSPLPLNNFLISFPAYPETPPLVPYAINYGCGGEYGLYFRPISPELAYFNWTLFANQKILNKKPSLSPETIIGKWNSPITYPPGYFDKNPDKVPETWTLDIQKTKTELSVYTEQNPHSDYFKFDPEQGRWVHEMFSFDSSIKQIGPYYLLDMGYFKPLEFEKEARSKLPFIIIQQDTKTFQAPHPLEHELTRYRKYLPPEDFYPFRENVPDFLTWTKE